MANLTNGSDNRMNKPENVVLGAGYGGILTTVKLQKQLRIKHANITLATHHLFQYLTTRLHEPALGTIHEHPTRVPIRAVVNLNKINRLHDTVVDMHWKAKEVRLENGVVTYDMLVIG